MLKDKQWRSEELKRQLSLACIIEAVLLSAGEPLTIKKLQEAIGNEHDTLSIQEAIESLQERWNGRGLQIVQLASGYRFITDDAMQLYIERARSSREPRYSKSVLETLAVIAYRQPVTRADIEHIRGVGLNVNAMRVLEARGWIVSVGVKQNSPGQPMLWGTTRKFLDDLGLQSLEQLPPLVDISQALHDTSGPDTHQLQDPGNPSNSGVQLHQDKLPLIPA